MSDKENIINESEQTEEIIEADAIDDSDVEVIEISDDSDDIPHSPTFSETEELVKSRIIWFRKWTKDVPNYIHSFHVREILKNNRFDETVQMAWLLHDIVEDWNTSLDELRSLWYSEEIVRLVDLATHDMNVNDSFERWKWMMKRLEDACDTNAWAIKLADISDNVQWCHTMPNINKKRRFLYEKCPYFVEQWNKLFWWSEFFLEFLRRYHAQLQRLVIYEKKRSAWRVWWIVTWLAFIWSVIIDCYWYYKVDISLMKLWLWIGFWLVLFMWIMHIICFRIPHKEESY